MHRTPFFGTQILTILTFIAVKSFKFVKVKETRGLTWVVIYLGDFVELEREMKGVKRELHYVMEQIGILTLV